MKQTKADKLFDAILAKNRIANQIANFKRDKEEFSIDVLIADLEAIELVIGQGNQPTVEDIIDHNSQKNQKFYI